LPQLPPIAPIAIANGNKNKKLTAKAANEIKCNP